MATDARRREVYWARYDAASGRLSGPAVTVPADLAPAGPDRPPVAGTGPQLYPDLLGEPIEPAYPAAGTLARLAAARLAAGEPVPGAEPVYLRRPDARVPGPPKRVTVP